jgi:DNA modification methylase
MPDWQNRIVETADMAVKELKANPKNWRKHPTAQQNALAGVLDEVGWVTQVIWNRQTGHLIDGHLRVELAAKRKEKTVPVNVVDLSPEEEAMILATFDPIAAMAEADRQMLQGLMQSIETEDEQIQALLESIARDEKIDLGGEPAEAPEPQIDRAAELQEQWQTARGQLWQCGDHRVLCGDSTSAENVARLMAGEMAIACVTDPPYGTASESKVQIRGSGIETFDIEWDKEAPTEWVPAISAVLEPGAGVISFWDNARITRLWELFEVNGIRPLQTVYWKKPTAPQPRQNFCSSIESAIYGRKTGPVLCWNGGGATPNVYENPRSAGLERTPHPTQKPLALITWLVGLISPEGGAVLDPFLGSGTTMIACEQLGRRCFGLEISPAYVAVILQRWHDMTGKDPVLVDE